MKNLKTTPSNLALVCVLALAAQHAAGNDQPPAPAVPAASTPATSVPVSPAASSTPSSTTTPELPKIRWSTTPAADTRDARVTVGTLRISMPNAPGTEPTPRTDLAATASASAPADPTLIIVPNNTIPRITSTGEYANEAYWQRSDRINAANRLANANADLAELQLERESRANNRGQWSSWGATFIRTPHTGGSYPRSHRSVGPFTTTTTTFDDLGSSAQRAFAEAATPRINAAEQDRANAVIRFGADATPQIIQAQRDRDAAVIKANKDNTPK